LLYLSQGNFETIQALLSGTNILQLTYQTVFIVSPIVVIIALSLIIDWIVESRSRLPEVIFYVAAVAGILFTFFAAPVTHALQAMSWAVLLLIVVPWLVVPPWRRLKEIDARLNSVKAFNRQFRKEFKVAQKKIKRLNTEFHNIQAQAELDKRDLNADETDRRVEIEREIREIELRIDVQLAFRSGKLAEIDILLDRDRPKTKSSSETSTQKPTIWHRLLKFVAFPFFCLFIVFVAAQYVASPIWLPAEEFTLANGASFSGYVVQQSQESYEIMKLHSSLITVVPIADIASEYLCINRDANMHTFANDVLKSESHYPYCDGPHGILNRHHRSGNRSKHHDVKKA